MNIANKNTHQLTHNWLNRNVIISGLGYFVDIYDLLLFGIVRKPSLLAIGVPENQLLSEGVFLLNMQMLGMLIGGIAWGIWGDRKGRLSVLFGSIFLYSAANIANGFVTDVNTYGALRFIAGLGLAGELGAAITLVSETMDKNSRGFGTSIVAGIGILGAVAGGLIGDYFSWKTAYIIGGVLGFSLLALRVSMYESGMFEKAREKSKEKDAHQTSHRHIRHGDFFSLFKNRERFSKYLRCILIGVPIWFIVGILITLSPELAVKLNVQGAVSAGHSILWCYAGLSVGDFLSGFLSQWIKSRLRAMRLFLAISIFATVSYLNSNGLSLTQFYTLCFILGFGAGYWAVFVTNAAEQFGTNLRATVTTTVPNFVRGSVPLMTMAFQYLSHSMGLVGAAGTVGITVGVLAFVSMKSLDESFGRDLDFLETHS